MAKVDTPHFVQGFTAGAPLFPGDINREWGADTFYFGHQDRVRIDEATVCSLAETPAASISKSGIVVSRAYNLLLVRAAFGETEVNPSSATDIVSVTWNGVALTKVVGCVAGSYGETLWVLVNPDVGTHTVVITADGVAGFLSGLVRQVWRVNPDTIISDVQTKSGSQASPVEFTLAADRGGACYLAGCNVSPTPLAALPLFPLPDGVANTDGYNYAQIGLPTVPHYMWEDGSAFRTCYTDPPESYLAWDVVPDPSLIAACAVSFAQLDILISQYDHLIHAEYCDVTAGAVAETDTFMGHMLWSVYGDQTDDADGEWEATGRPYLKDGSLTPTAGRGQVYAECDITVEAAALADEGYPIFEPISLQGTGAFEEEMVLQIVPNVDNDWNATPGLHTVWVYSRAATSGSVNPTMTSYAWAVATLPTADLLGLHRFRLEGKCGTLSAGPVVAADGWVKVYLDEVEIGSTQTPIWTNCPTTPTARITLNTRHASDSTEWGRFNRVWFGVAGFMGPYNNLEAGYWASGSTSSSPSSSASGSPSPGAGGEIRALRRLRQGPFLSDERAWLYHHKFQLDIEVGVGLASGQGSDPHLMLQWSDDRGHSWSHEHWVSAGRLGEFRRRAIWRRLGRSRDRAYRVTVSDPVKWVLIDAHVDVEKGRR